MREQAFFLLFNSIQSQNFFSPKISTESEISTNIKVVDVKIFEEDFGWFDHIFNGIVAALSQKNGMLVWIHDQLIFEDMLPNLSHLVPVLVLKESAHLDDSLVYGFEHF